MSICVYNVIGSETSPVNSVLVVRLTLVVTSIFLCSWVYLHLGLHRIIPNWPLMYLKETRTSLEYSKGSAGFRTRLIDNEYFSLCVC